MVAAAGLGLASASGRALEANLSVGAIASYVLYVLLNVLAAVALGALLQNSAAAIAASFALPAAVALLGTASTLLDWIDMATAWKWMLDNDWGGHVPRSRSRSFSGWWPRSPPVSFGRFVAMSGSWLGPALSARPILLLTAFFNYPFLHSTPFFDRPAKGNLMFRPKLLLAALAALPVVAVSATTSLAASGASAQTPVTTAAASNPLVYATPGKHAVGYQQFTTRGAQNRNLKLRLWYPAVTTAGGVTPTLRYVKAN